MPRTKSKPQFWLDVELLPEVTALDPTTARQLTGNAGLAASQCDAVANRKVDAGGIPARFCRRMHCASVTICNIFAAHIPYARIGFPPLIQGLCTRTRHRRFTRDGEEWQ